jgi:hypothetical protein
MDGGCKNPQRCEEDEKRYVDGLDEWIKEQRETEEWLKSHPEYLREDRE